MKLIIDIPEEDYKTIIQRPKQCVVHWDIVDALRNGTPLPKEHGRLIDEKQVIMALIHHDFLKDNVKCGDITKILDMATIIEAERGE